jgi:hypothetical protein
MENHEHVWSFNIVTKKWKCLVCGKIVTRSEMDRMMKGKVMIGGVLVDENIFKYYKKREKQAKYDRIV